MRFGLPSCLVRGAPTHHRPLAADALAARLVAYEACLHRLPAWSHASWLAAVGLPLPAAHHPSLAAALGVGTLPARLFDQPAGRMALLPPSALCRVLRARALLRRRPALRRCVEPRLRRRMDEWLHPAVFDAVLLESPDDDLRRDVDGLPLPPAATMYDAPDALAWEGFCLFRQDAIWTDPLAARLVRLGFDRCAVPPPQLEELPGAAGASRWVLDRLARFVPEVPWLCG